MTTPRLTDRELVAALVEIHEQVRELRAEVAEMRAAMARNPGAVVRQIDGQGFAVAAPRKSA